MEKKTVQRKAALTHLNRCSPPRSSHQPCENADRKPLLRRRELRLEGGCPTTWRCRTKKTRRGTRGRGRRCSSQRFQGQPLPSASTDEQYEIEKIVAHKKRKDGKKVYLVKWQGYTYEECTWEPAKHFKGDTLRAYHKGRREAKDDESDSSSDDEDHETVATCVAIQRQTRDGDLQKISLDTTRKRDTRDVEMSSDADLARAGTKPSEREPAQGNHDPACIVHWGGDQFV